MESPINLDIIRQMCLVLDMIVNSICVILNFDVADKMYFCLNFCGYKSNQELNGYMLEDVHEVPLLRTGAVNCNASGLKICNLLFYITRLVL